MTAADAFLLLDIGQGAGALPNVTPAPVRYGSWFPLPHDAAPVPAVSGLKATAVADGVLLEWEAVPLADAVYRIERAPGASGPWTEVARTTNTRWLHSDDDGALWHFRISALVRGRAGEGITIAGSSKTIPGTADLIALQQRLDQEIAERFSADAAAAAERAEESLARTQALAAEAAARAAAVDAAQERLHAILSDSILSADEKPQVILDYTALTDELPGISVEATASAATAELTAYTQALTALTTYLATLTTPTAWNDTTGDTRLT